MMCNLLSHNSGSKDVVGPKGSLGAPFGVPSTLLNRRPMNILAIVLNLAHGRLIGKGAKEGRGLRIGALHSMAVLQIRVRCDRREGGGSNDTCRRWDGVCHGKRGT